MSGILDISISGLNAATARIANAASSIVNASSTPSAAKNSISNTGGGSLDGAIIDSITARVDYGANAAAIKIENKIQKSLLDITA